MINERARKLLKHEIDTKDAHIEMLVKNNHLETAAREAAVLEGLKWARFVLVHNEHI